jgi:hypothetical protein
LVKIFRHDERDGIKFRPGRFGIVPYCQIPVVRADGVCAIREIVIGPTNYEDDAQRALELLLKVAELDSANIEIRHSKIPIR